MTPRQQARAAVHVETLARTTLANGDLAGAAVLYETAARIHEAAGAMTLARQVRALGGGYNPGRHMLPPTVERESVAALLDDLIEWQTAVMPDSCTRYWQDARRMRRTLRGIPESEAEGG